MPGRDPVGSQGLGSPSVLIFSQWMEHRAPSTVPAIGVPEKKLGREKNGCVNGAFLGVEAGTFMVLGKV